MSTYRLSYAKMDLIVKNWQLLADKYGGVFNSILSKSPAIIDPINTEVKRYELYIPYDDHLNIVYMTSETSHFKVEFDFAKKLDFEFQIYPEDFIDKISKVFGMKEIELENRKFDKKYILKSNRTEIFQSIFDSATQNEIIKFGIYSCRLATKDTSKLQITPFIREEEFEEMEEFTLFVIKLIERINNNGY